MKMQRISSKTTKTSSKPKSKKCIIETNAKSNPNYLSNRSKKCKTRNNSITSTSNSDNNNNNKNNKRKKCTKKVKSRAVKSDKSSNNNNKRSKMNRSGTSSSSPLSSPRAKSKSQMTTIITPVMLSNEDEINEMPILTPEVPILTPIADSEMIGTIHSKVTTNDVNFIDLVPPVLSPALDQDNNNTKINKTNVSEKSRNKPKYQIHTFQDSPQKYSIFSDQEFNSYNEFNLISPKKVKKSVKNSTKVNKIPKNSNKFLQKSIQKSIQKSKGKLYNNNISNSFNTKTNKTQNMNELNDWSVDCNHTMTSTNTSFPKMYSFMDYRNDNNFESILSNNNNIDNSFKLIKPKLFKKSKTCFNSQTNKRTKKSLFNDLIGVQKPEAEIDEIEGIVFQSFETEDSINLFSKFETLEKDQQRDQSSSFKYKIKSFKSGKVIFPTKTKDITKIKGWREKLFSSIDQKQSKKSMCKPLDNSSFDNTYSSLLFDPMTAQSSKGSNSAFVSDILDGYLKNKKDLRINYLDPDLAPPPDDSPIFSASVLKMPDFNDSMPPPLNPSTSQLTTPPTNKRKGNFGRSKGLKNKLDLKTDFNDTFDFLDDETENSQQFLPQFPIIRETLWPETPLSDERLNKVFEEYINITYNELQMMKKYNCPSFIMDDHYARYALSALQCNQRIVFTNSDSNDNDNVLTAVGLAPKPKVKELSPVKETEIKITGRYRKDRDADLARIIAMGNRSKRQIRLPSRFHESSLLMGNQWIIPDYDSKGKTGKRRLQQEQKRLQELHQRQLELEQRNHLVQLNDQMTSNNDDFQLTNRSLKKNKSNVSKNQKVKPNVKAFSIPVVTNEYPIKIPQQRLKELQIMRKNQNKSTNNKSEQLLAKKKSFTSLYPLATQTSDDKRHVSLSAKAAASASQRAVVNQLFYQLFDTISPEKQTMFSRNGKINKLEVIKEAIETIEKLTKRDQQLCYIRKLLSMWNHKLQLCSKVAQKDMKPEAFKVVNEVMNTYKNSMCYKVGEALEAKRKEFLSQQKKSILLGNQNHSSSSNSSQIINIPITNSNGTPFKTPKSVTHRLILPKLSPIHKNIPKASNSEIVMSPNSNSNYPKLTTPDLHQRTVSDFSVDTEFISREGSLLKPPILTTRPTVLKPFILNSNEDSNSSKSVTGPIINVPNIARIKSMAKSISICKTKPQLIGSNKSHVSNSKISSSLINSSAARFKFPLNCIPMTGSYVSKAESEGNSGEKRNLMMGINAFIPIGSSANNITGVTSTPSVNTSNSQSRPQNIFSPHAYAGKSVIITSETPLANEDLSKIVASIAANPDNFNKVPVRLSNGLSALTIPGPIDMPLSAKLSNYTSSNSASGATPQSISNNSQLMIRTKQPNNNNNKISDLNEDSKSLINKSNPFCTINQSSNLTLNNVSAKPNILQKQSVLPKLNAIIGMSNDNDLNGVKSEKTDSKTNSD